MNDKTTPAVTGSQLILGAITATMAVITYVWKLSPEFSSIVLAALTAWFGVAAWAWPKFLASRKRVVEETTDGRTVVAGEANELETGEVIRENLGELRPRRAAPEE